MLKKSILLKFFGIFSAVVNLTLAGIYMELQSSMYFLASLSLMQIGIPFTGFGLSSALVSCEHDKEIGYSLSDKLVVLFRYLIFMGLLHSGLYLISFGYSADNLSLLSAILGLQLVLVLAEPVRAASADISGFMYFNGALLIGSIDIYLNGSPGWFAFVISLSFSVLLLRRYYFCKGEYYLQVDVKSGAWKSISVTILNQYMNVLVVVLSLFGGPALPSVVAAAKFNMLFSWPVFMWMRVGHKSVAGTFELDQLADMMEKNRRAIFLNLFFLVVILSGTVLVHEVHQLAELLLFQVPLSALLLTVSIWGCVRVGFMFFFPYEILFVYRESYLKTFLLLCAALVVFAGLTSFIGVEAVFVLCGVEVLLFMQRIYFKKLTGELP